MSDEGGWNNENDVLELFKNPFQIVFSMNEHLGKSLFLYRILLRYVNNFIECGTVDEHIFNSNFAYSDKKSHFFIIFCPLYTFSTDLATGVCASSANILAGLLHPQHRSQRRKRATAMHKIIIGMST